jgi:hypothetical protein
VEPDFRLDFVIPASPNDGFYSQIAFFRLALDRLGGIYRQARLVAVLKMVRLTAAWSKTTLRLHCPG